jgi:hypothetical protein
MAATVIVAATAIAVDTADAELMAVEFAPMAAHPVDTQVADMPEAMLAVVTPVVT